MFFAFECCQRGRELIRVEFIMELGINSNLKGEGDESVEPPSMDMYCLVSRVVTSTGVRITGLSSFSSPLA